MFAVQHGFLEFVLSVLCETPILVSSMMVEAFDHLRLRPLPRLAFPFVSWFDWVPCLRCSEVGVAQNSAGGVTKVLVHVSTYQGSILAPFF